MTLSDLDGWFRALLRFEATEAIDRGFSGIQVGRRNPEVKKAAFAVDASMEAFRRAAQWGADLLFVHHGIFWDRMPALTGTLYERVRALVESDIALYAVHLPLDMHPEVGNNIGIARRLGLRQIEPFGSYKGVKVGLKGVCDPMSVEQVSERLMGTPAQVHSLPFGPERVSRIGIVSGDGAEDAGQAVREGLELLITGEASHAIYHDCLEAGIHVMFAGHYFTETFGVRLVQERLARETGVETRYLDLPTGL